MTSSHNAAIACENGAGEVFAPPAISQLPPEYPGGVAGRATFRAPASGSGKEASHLSLVFRSLQQEHGTKRRFYETG